MFVNLETAQNWYYKDRRGEALIDIVAYNCDNDLPDPEEYAIYRCDVDTLLKATETEKAVRIPLEYNKAFFIPKKAIIDWWQGDKKIPRGFAVKFHWAKHNAQSGGPFWFPPKEAE